MTNLVSPKQTDFINTLLRERDVDTYTRSLAAHVDNSLAASRYITLLLTKAKLPRVAPAVAAGIPSARDKYFAALDAAEPAKYAVPTKFLANLDMNLPGDLFFFEVKVYKGKHYMNRLTGAPGAFNRSRVPMLAATAILALVANRHVEFSKLFSDNFHVCGRCAAPLTDQRSRETGFGPECRRVFGI